MADPSYLVPLIRQILSSPDVDLSVISAKRVRERILLLDPSIEQDYIRRNKAEIDLLIANVFDEVRSGSLAPPVHEINPIPPSSAQTSPTKRKRSSSPTPSSPPAVAVKEKEKKTPAATKKRTGGMTDEEFARQLNSQLNAVRTRGSSSGSSRMSRKSAGKKVRKSKTTVDEDSDEDGDEDDGQKPVKKKKKASAGAGGAKGGFGKEFSLSDPLANMIQVARSSRPQVVKKIWEYIKENSLQNPANKKEIISDAKFRAVFNLDKVDMFQMNKLLGEHLFPLEG